MDITSDARIASINFFGALVKSNSSSDPSSNNLFSFFKLIFGFSSVLSVGMILVVVLIAFLFNVLVIGPHIGINDLFGAKINPCKGNLCPTPGNPSSMVIFLLFVNCFFIFIVFMGWKGLGTMGRFSMFSSSKYFDTGVSCKLSITSQGLLNNNELLGKWEDFYGYFIEEEVLIIYRKIDPDLKWYEALKLSSLGKQSVGLNLFYLKSNRDQFLQYLQGYLKLVRNV